MQSFGIESSSKIQYAYYVPSSHLLNKHRTLDYTMVNNIYPSTSRRYTKVVRTSSSPLRPSSSYLISSSSLFIILRYLTVSFSSISIIRHDMYPQCIQPSLISYVVRLQRSSRILSGRLFITYSLKAGQQCRVLLLQSLRQYSQYSQ